MKRVGCAVLGATGAVGQRFVHLLRDHPWFDIRAVTASPGAAGQSYATGANWFLDESMPASVATLTLSNPDALVLADTPIVFSALPGGIAGDIESDLAARGFRVFTNARDHRMNPDVPLLLPEVNADALPASTGGSIVANGNCSGIILTLALAPLQRAFGLNSVDVTTMQARSGAGNPATVDLDTPGNILPFIGGEEDKLETEPHKVLGTDFPIRATCTRVDVDDGHFESVHCVLGKSATADEIREAFATFRGPAHVVKLPSSPKAPIHVFDDQGRPQPKLDRDLGVGMAISIGRIRVDGRHVRFVVLGHNTIRGAAGQSILNAELSHSQNPAG